MEHVKIADADAEQLRAFGAQVLGLDLGGRENRQAMIAKFTACGYNVDSIKLPPAAPVPSSKPRQEGAFNVRTTDKGVEEVRIIVHTQDVPGGERPVPVSVNGRLMLIPRGKEIWVPKTYVEVLDHAVESIYSEYNAEEDNLGGLKTPRQVKSYPFSYA